VILVILKFLETTSHKFEKIFIIAGNHEYYNNDIIKTKEHISLICKNYKNISFLDNSSEYYKNYNFIGTTLWSHITKPAFVINDTKLIKNFSIPEYY